MTVGQIIGLVAVIAFVALVIFMAIFLVRLTKMVDTMNQRLNSLSNNVNEIAKQSEKILAESNVLLDDIEHKMKVIDPVFTAAADLGRTVTKFNKMVNRSVDRVNRKRKLRKSAWGKLGQYALGWFSNRKKK